MSGRASPSDWCAAGLALLRDEGIDAVTVDRLCAALRKTKGSFYHHFQDLDAYLAALLARWEEELTEAPIRAAGRAADPARRGARLDRAVRALDHRLDGAVRAWARWDRRARAAVERVDGRRVAYVAELYRAAGSRQPHVLADVEYAAFVGAQALGLFEAPARATRLAAALRSALDALARTPAFRGERRRRRPTPARAPRRGR